MWKTCYRERPIKFRGRDIDTGEYRYAKLGEISAEINPEYLTFITDDAYIVDADSVVQLVGYDKNGKEVYEGDILVDENDPAKPPYKEYTVEFKVHGYKHGACVTFKARINAAVLKEAEK